MITRLAAVSDAQTIADIVNPVIRDTAITFNAQERSATDIAQAIETLPCYLVAEDVGEVIGFASYDQFRKGIGYARAMEHTIVLAKTARGKGAGRALMSAVTDHARAAGVGSLWAGVSSENPAGVAFHTSLGFETIATLPKVGFKFGRWMDLVLMRQWLDPKD
ncbi:MAG: N-acetyltransferase family protein [Paracoccaceae bacterium]|uniref:GNAT family N-acetyltransferase n=1 Tax=Parasphingorhabdus sp. TaxID=2709688 RepID=UPI0032872C37